MAASDELERRLYLFILLGEASLCIPGSSEICLVDQAGFKFATILLLLPPEYSDHKCQREAF